jgi:UDP-N-acetylglucosamine:LPS N-acetylglucosamine transferase
VVIDERAPDALDRIEERLGHWVSHPGELADMAQASRALGRPQAAAEMARLVLKLMDLEPAEPAGAEKQG